MASKLSILNLILPWVLGAEFGFFGMPMRFSGAGFLGLNFLGLDLLGLDLLGLDFLGSDDRCQI
jgi:hypothetical protein